MPADVFAAVSNWSVPFLAGSPVDVSRLSPLRVDEDWRPLGQSWRKGSLAPAFHAGWAQLHWNSSALHVGAVLIGSQQRNRARRLNERTWELGDVCEVFLQTDNDDRYLELHVTPENHRLQLRWPADGLARFRRNEAPLEAFLVDHANWVKSSTRVGPGFWAAQLTIPWSCLGVDALVRIPTVSVAVCRYDCGNNAAPVFSSTAPLCEPDFHRRHEWQPLALAPAASGE